MTRISAYLDYNATAPVWPEAAAAVAHALSMVGNPSSVHRQGRMAHRQMEDARAEIARLIGADPAEIVFTSGGTEANNLAFDGLAARGQVARLLVSVIEHPSVLEAARKTGLPVTEIPVTADGIVDLAALEAALGNGDGRALVSVMYANNETGVIQPVAEIVRLAHEVGALVHCDAIQAAGKVPLDFAALGVDLMTLSAHKLGGPQGVGALIVRDGIDIAASHVGGGQERGKRAGTENVPGIAGFGKAAECARAALERMDEVRALRDALERRLKQEVRGTVIFGGGAERLPTTTCLSAPRLEAEKLVMKLDLAGVAVSAGSACSSGKVTRSHVLDAMGIADDLAKGAVRVSLGWFTSEQETGRFADVWTETALRASGAAQTKHVTEAQTAPVMES